MFGFFGRNTSAQAAPTATGFDCGLLANTHSTGRSSAADSQVPVRVHKPGYAAPAAATYKTTRPNPDKSSRETTIRAKMSEEPIPANSSLVSLDFAVAAYETRSTPLGDQVTVEVLDASTNASGDYALSSEPTSVSDPGFKGRISRGGFGVAVGNVAGDARSEEILAFRPNFSDPPKIRITGKLENGGSFTSDVTAIISGTTELFFATGYDGAFWIGEWPNTVSTISWERWGQSQASGYGVTATALGNSAESTSSPIRKSSL